MRLVLGEISKSSVILVRAIDTAIENWLQFSTDAGQYVVRFGDVLPKYISPQSAPNFEEAHYRKPFLSSMNEKSGAEEVKKLQQAADQVHLHSRVNLLSSQHLKLGENVLHLLCFLKLNQTALTSVGGN